MCVHFNYLLIISLFLCHVTFHFSITFGGRGWVGGVLVATHRTLFRNCPPAQFLILAFPHSCNARYHRGNNGPVYLASGVSTTSGLFHKIFGSRSAPARVPFCTCIHSPAEHEVKSNRNTSFSREAPTTHYSAVKKKTKQHTAASTV